jgi:hypothetical protein
MTGLTWLPTWGDSMNIVCHQYKMGVVPIILQ